MGASSSCQCCAEHPAKGQTTAVPTSGSARAGSARPGSARAGSARGGSKNGSRESPRSKKPGKMAAHEGQRRASLVVKGGGFSLGNFAATNTKNIEECYDISSKIIGEGAFGKVMVASEKASNQRRAVKSIQKTAAAEVKKLLEEIEIVRLLDHPNIVRLCESFEDRKTIYLVMELCEGGELFERIVEAGSFTEAVAAQCVKQMLLAINYLHQNSIIHRDLKPENWLVSSKEPVEKSTLKLIDFGISKRLKPGETCTSKAGTPYYVAPEVMTGRYTEKVDVWSTGVITYIMLSGLQPFPGRTTDEILQAVQRAKVVTDGKSWTKISAAAKGLVKSLLQKTPSVRPAALQAMQHAWFSSMPDAADESFLSKMEIDNLKCFSKFNKVKKAAITIVAAQLSDQRIDYLKSMFLQMDDNHDGTLSIAELKKGLRAAGIKIPKDLAKTLEEVDTDGSGVLDYTEFLAATLDKKLFSQENLVWAAFRKFDVDGSGSISKAELLQVLGDDVLKDELAITGDSDQIAKLFSEIDTNGDGVVDFDEFFAMIRAAEDDSRDAGSLNRSTSALLSSANAPSPRPASGRSSRSPKGTKERTK